MESPLPEDRIEELYRQHAPVIHRRCLALLGDVEEARDATHDIFVTLLGKLDSFRGQSSPATWIYRIATNHCLNRLRGRKVRRQALARMIREELPTRTVAPAAVAVERRDLLCHLLGQFDARKVQIVVHAHYDEMTQREIGELMGVSERAVRKTLAKVVRHVRAEGAALDALADVP